MSGSTRSKVPTETIFNVCSYTVTVSDSDTIGHLQEDPRCEMSGKQWFHYLAADFYSAIHIPCGGSSLLQAGWCVACGPVAPVVLLKLLEVEGLDTEPHPFGCVWIRVGLFVSCGPSLTGD